MKSRRRVNSAVRHLRLPVLVNSNMRFVGAVVQIPIYCLIAFSQSSPPPCGSSLTPQEAYARATAVFLGRVLSVTTLYHPGTKLAGPKPYHQVELQVEESWKLVDRQEITLETENTVPNTCGSFSPGETYLIYADRLNDIFFVSISSRTNRVANAGEDLKVLGEPRLLVRFRRISLAPCSRLWRVGLCGYSVTY
jgi:hypothetical protein